MRIRRVQIDRFRGIKSLDWSVDGDFVCLIGAGDSTKTTILDAIEVALLPRWSFQFDDTDFFDANTSEPITILLTIGDLPNELKSDAKLGLHTRGWSPAGELHDEPAEGDELVLSVRLLVDESLEPAWTVVNDRTPDGVMIGWRDREKLSCARLGDSFDRHFSWGRGSVLSRLTEKGENLSRLLADASRAARTALASDTSGKLKTLQDTAKRAEQVGKRFGVRSRASYCPSLESQAISLNVGGFGLYDGDIPLRRLGLGSRRLLAVAMQREATTGHGVALVDELEHGLEPHRQRRAVRQLREPVGEGPCGQMVMTTHSPTVLSELGCEEIRIVRTAAGVTRIFKVESSLHPVLLKSSDAFFARRVFVCEGKTELGLCRALDEWWAASGPSLALSGVALADGGGSEAPVRAKVLADLGYEVLLLADSDCELTPSLQELAAAGVVVVQWADACAVEERLAFDLPWAGLTELLALAAEHRCAGSVRDAVAARLGDAGVELPADSSLWGTLGLVECEIRKAIGAAAKKQKNGKREGWFKTVYLGEELGRIVASHYAELANTDLAQKIGMLKSWAHADE